MPLMGFEPTIPVFERSKIFHALDRAATMTGRLYMHINNPILDSLTCRLSSLYFMLPPEVISVGTLCFISVMMDASVTQNR
jgi:hypothetical protein